jgi:hypothetical protein
MELIALGVLLWLLYWGMRLLTRFFAFLGGGRHRAYHILAARHRGRVESRGVSDPPTVSFAHKGSSVRIGLAPNAPGQSHGPRFRVVSRFPKGIPFRLELAPRSRAAPTQAPKGTRLVRIRDPQFHRDYLVQANDPDIADDWLGAGSTREAIERLRRLCPPSGMLLSVNPERILVQVDRNLAAQPEALLSAVAEALWLHDRLLECVHRRVAQGIAIIDAGPPQGEVVEAPLCKICCGPIEDANRRVLCAVCQTPHHDDCWEFNGGCSVYGCKGKQAKAG